MKYVSLVFIRSIFFDFLQCFFVCFTSHLSSSLWWDGSPFWLLYRVWFCILTLILSHSSLSSCLPLLLINFFINYCIIFCLETLDLIHLFGSGVLFSIIILRWIWILLSILYPISLCLFFSIIGRRLLRNILLKPHWICIWLLLTICMLVLRCTFTLPCWRRITLLILTYY